MSESYLSAMYVIACKDSKLFLISQFSNSLDLCQESVVVTPFLNMLFLHIIKYVVSLQRVFHSIRFKVNKG